MRNLLRTAIFVAALSFSQDSQAVVREAFTGLGDEFSCDQYDSGQWKSAINELTVTLKEKSANADALMSRGLAYSCLGNEQQAIADYTASLAILADSPRTLYVRAISYENLGDSEQAIADYTAAIKLNPRYAEAFNNRAEIYKRHGERQLAIADLSEAIRIFPNYADAYVNRAEIYSEMGSMVLAKSDFDKALEIDPTDAFAFIDRGTMYFRQGDYGGAVADFSKAHDLDPNEPIALHDRCQARAWGNLDLDAALQDCNADLAQRPGWTATLVIRAIIYLRMKRYDDAIADDDMVVSQSPRNGYAIFSRGLAKHAKGDSVGGNSDLALAQSIYKGIDAIFRGIGLRP